MKNIVTRSCIAVLTFALGCGPALAQGQAQTPNSAPASGQKTDQKGTQDNSIMPLPKPGDVLPNEQAPTTGTGGSDANAPGAVPADNSLPNAPSATPQNANGQNANDQQGGDTQDKPAQQPTVTPVGVDNSANNPAADEAQPSRQVGSADELTREQEQTEAARETQKKTNTQPALGTAAAESGRTYGGAASRPAGVAIAPSKQKQSRTFLIRVAALAASAAALGTVYALSKKTSPTPPNAVK